jgi:hypothetical protein
MPGKEGVRPDIPVTEVMLRVLIPFCITAVCAAVVVELVEVELVEVELVEVEVELLVVEVLLVEVEVPLHCPVVKMILIVSVPLKVSEAKL